MKKCKRILCLSAWAEVDREKELTVRGEKKKIGGEKKANSNWNSLFGFLSLYIAFSLALLKSKYLCKCNLIFLRQIQIRLIKMSFPSARCKLHISRFESSHIIQMAMEALTRPTSTYKPRILHVWNTCLEWNWVCLPNLTTNGLFRSKEYEKYKMIFKDSNLMIIDFYS